MSKAKRLLANLALTAFVLLVALLFCEFVVRLLYKDQTVLFPRYHTDYRYGQYAIRGVRPNSEYWLTSVDGSWKYVTNSKGFRNAKEFSYAKPANTMRVLSLGDSHTQGYEARQDFTFSAVLERFLAQRSTAAEVINAGVSGFSTAEELVFLENEGIRYQPDAVLLGFYANDFEDNLKAGLFGLDGDGRLVETKHEHLPGVRIQNVLYSIAPVRWLSENSYFYSLLFNTVWSYFKEALRSSAVQQSGANGESVAEGFEYAVPTSTAFSRAQVALAAALVERMHRFCEARGVRFIVIDIPRRGPADRFASSMPPELLERLAAKRIEIVHSQPLLEDYAGAAELHVAHGHGHISEVTHALLGVEIGRRLLAGKPSGSESTTGR